MTFDDLLKLSFRIFGFKALHGTVSTLKESAVRKRRIHALRLSLGTWEFYLTVEELLVLRDAQ